MKKILIIIAIVILGFIYDKTVNYYSMNGVVYEYEKGAFVILDNTDNLWEIDYTNQFKIGDKVKITFYTNGTDNERIDDKITSVIKIDD